MLAALVLAIAATADAAPLRASDRAAAASVNVTGSYEFYVHVQAGVTVVGTLHLKQAGHKLSGSAQAEGTDRTIRGKISGTSLHFNDIGAAGYVAHFFGNASCGGNSLIGSWIDTSQEGGSWNAYRGTSTTPPPGTACVYQVSGRVTKAATGRGAGGVDLRARCRRGGTTTTTEANGDYSFTLSPGRCHISVLATPGATAKPVQRSVHVTNHNLSGVDFQISCNGGAQGSSGVLASTASGSSSCLQVSAKLLEPLRSGLAVHSIHYNLAPADFISQGGHGFACESGCSEVLVTVVDPATHQPVDKAILDAKISDPSLGQLTLADGRVFTPRAVGHGWICETDASGSPLTKCAMDSLPGLTTDPGGHVYLRFFTPGVIVPARTKLTLDATACSTPCTTKETGTAQLQMKTAPYLIYRNRGADLTPEDVKILSEWAAGGSALNKFLEKNTQAFNTLSKALKVLKAAEVAAQRVTQLLEQVEHAEPVVAIVDIILGYNTYLETKAMVAMFLDKAGLSAIGLGEPSAEASVDASPSRVFTNELVNQIFAPEFLKLGNGGWWWVAAKTIRHAQAAGELGGRWALKVSVYEVSNCDPTDGPCGAGYVNNPGFGQVIRGGIKPELAFDLTLEHRIYVQRLHRGLVSSYEDVFLMPYDAIAWTETQTGIMGRIQDFAP